MYRTACSKRRSAQRPERAGRLFHARTRQRVPLVQQVTRVDPAEIQRALIPCGPFHALTRLWWYFFIYSPPRMVRPSAIHSGRIGSAAARHASGIPYVLTTHGIDLLFSLDSALMALPLAPHRDHQAQSGGTVLSEALPQGFSG